MWTSLLQGIRLIPMTDSCSFLAWFPSIETDQRPCVVYPNLYKLAIAIAYSYVWTITGWKTEEIEITEEV